MYTVLPVTTGKIPARAAAPRYGAAPALPWDIRLSRNHIMNRLFIESIGKWPWSLLLVRNNVERLEHGLNIAAYWSIGIMMPLLMGALFNQRYANHLRNKFGLMKKTGNPLEMPFSWLERHQYQKLQSTPPPVKELAKYGLRNIRQLTPKLAKNVRNAKLAIIFMDIMMLTLKSGFYWVRNWLTERMTGQKGFSGIMSEASKEYVEKKAAGYEKGKQKRLFLSFGLGVFAAVSLPLAILAALKSPAKAGKGFLGKFKNITHAFDYNKVIFMSKWTLMWSTLFSYNLMGLLSSRDSHELRERVVNNIIFDTFYFFGDDLLSGSRAKHLQNKYKKQLKGIPLYSERTFLNWKIPVATSYNKVFDMVNGNKKHMAFKLAKETFWFGLLGTTLFLGILTPIANIAFTRLKVKRELAELEAKKQAAVASKPASSNLNKKQPIEQVLQRTPMLQAQPFWNASPPAYWPGSMAYSVPVMPGYRFSATAQAHQKSVPA